MRFKRIKKERHHKEAGGAVIVRRYQTPNQCKDAYFPLVVIVSPIDHNPMLRPYGGDTLPWVWRR